MNFFYDDDDEEEEDSFVIPVNEGELPDCLQDKHTYEISKHGDLEFSVCVICGHGYYEKSNNKID